MPEHNERDPAEETQGLILDIGLSWMASKSQHPLWLSAADAERFLPQSDAVEVQLSIVDSAVAEAHGMVSMQIGEDVRRLLASPLTDGALRTVWLGVTQAYFDPADHNLTGRDWLRRIEQTWLTSIRRRGMTTFTPSPPNPVTDPVMREAVLQEMRSVAGDLEREASKAAVPSLVPALEAVVIEACADLGYRLFLRAMKAYFVEITSARCEALTALGEAFRYPEFLVDDHLNVWDG
ncbi:hypothetical protein CG740_34800 [Streptomyces sp. CB01201]|uniref:hypothetical protein n=1 Tax=Streptomyces sp. CB01201 TaxID=2020324 RepID=UPI000C272901|nr:hypothetical protein [Streptomyces sp. CB01201]PJM98612.1 hypothetical protein CG740_34800 [Streptomyces sp. CB01201]